MDLKVLNSDWVEPFGNPMVIAGPCSAESEHQVLETARRIKETQLNIKIFRAGIWKPRTKPGMFEGVGEIGLQWMKRAKEEFGFKIATEVATAYHVEAALKAEVDVLWIGARSTVNPFTVQEIAESLKGTDKIVLVKNPVNPDLSLWLGALERLVYQGIEKLGVIHRGFSSYQKTKYRNIPNWQIALDLKNNYPNIPILVDPSHICGNRENLFDIAQEALNIGYNGMIIETHYSPDQAWSDAFQQIIPEELEKLMNRLQVRSTDLPLSEQKMEKQRTLISELDFQVIELLSRRMRVSKKIGEIKKEYNMAIFQPERWKLIVDYVEKKAEEFNLNKDFLEKIFKIIHEESIDVQNKIMK